MVQALHGSGAGAQRLSGRVCVSGAFRVQHVFEPAGVPVPPWVRAGRRLRVVRQRVGPGELLGHGGLHRVSHWIRGERGPHRMRSLPFWHVAKPRTERVQELLASELLREQLGLRALRNHVPGDGLRVDPVPPRRRVGVPALRAPSCPGCLHRQVPLAVRRGLVLRCGEQELQRVSSAGVRAGGGPDAVRSVLGRSVRPAVCEREHADAGRPLVVPVRVGVQPRAGAGAAGLLWAKGVGVYGTGLDVNLDLEQARVVRRSEVYTRYGQVQEKDGEENGDDNAKADPLHTFSKTFPIKRNTFYFFLRDFNNVFKVSEVV